MDNNQVTPAQIAPELRAATRLMPPLPIGTAWGRWLVRTALKLVNRDKPYAGVRLEKRTAAGGVPLRIYQPASGPGGAALLWLHGGGMVIGAAAQDDAFCATVARELRLVVVSVDYRLAPEFPFPGPLDDCFRAWQWLLAAAPQLQVVATRVAVGGMSAGGGLAASLVQRIHDAGGLQPRAQWLFSPMLDDRTAARPELDAIQHKLWNNRLNRLGWQAYLGTVPGAAQVPAYAVPARRSDLQGLPATWIGMGDIELFFAEDQLYAHRLQAAGVACAVDIVAGAYHGFERLAATTPLTQAYLARSRDWLRQTLGG